METNACKLALLMYSVKPFLRHLPVSLYFVALWDFLEEEQLAVLLKRIHG